MSDHDDTPDAAAAERTNDDGAGVDPKLLEILVCPITKGPLTYDEAAQELISKEAGLAYPIRDGIPVMLIDEADVADEAEFDRVMMEANKSGQSDNK